jgi:putative membrane protein
MNSRQARTFFSSADLEKIKQAVEAAEASTSGEIATMVVDQSDSYREAETLGAVLVAGLLALIGAVALNHVTVWTYIPLVFLLFFPSRWLMGRYPYLKLPFVGRRRVAEAVRERAVRAFFEKGLYRTRDETGILIFISLLERKVWILGDRGIDRKISLETWQVLARELSAGIREERACAAFLSVIDKCGKILAEHFPKKRDDTNELADEVMV